MEPDIIKQLRQNPTKIVNLLTNSWQKNFPDISEIPEQDPSTNGIIALGGDYSATRLLEGYQKGIFSWGDKNLPPVWCSPFPRTVFKTENWQPPRHLRRTIKKHTHWQSTINQHFAEVLLGCADRQDTWLLPELQQGLIQLHKLGYACSFEVHEPIESIEPTEHAQQIQQTPEIQQQQQQQQLTDESTQQPIEQSIAQPTKLIGGLYGIALPPLFFAESMFHKRSGASKIAFANMMNYAKTHNWQIIDAQAPTENSFQLGAELISKQQFTHYLQQIKT